MSLSVLSPTYVALPSLACICAVASPLSLHAFAASAILPVFASVSAKGIRASMTVRWPTRAAVRCLRVSKASRAVLPRKEGVMAGWGSWAAEAMREVVNPARKMENMAPRVPPQASSMISVSWRKRWTRSPSAPRPEESALRVASAPWAHVSPQSPSPTIWRSARCSCWHSGAEGASPYRSDHSNTRGVSVHSPCPTLSDPAQER
jgi:hypothetical protein